MCVAAVVLRRAASCLTPGCSPSPQTIESNWRCGRHNLQRIQCRSENSKGVYCLQYDDEKIISGLRDNSIKVNTSFGLFPRGEGVILLGKLAACVSFCPMKRQVFICAGFMGMGWLLEPGKVLTLVLCSGNFGGCSQRSKDHKENGSSCHTNEELHGPLSLAVSFVIASRVLSHQLSMAFPVAFSCPLFHCSVKNLPQNFFMLKGRTVPLIAQAQCPPILPATSRFPSSFQLWQSSSLGSVFLILISRLYFLFLTDLGQNKLGMFESINRTYWLGSLSAV